MVQSLEQITLLTVNEQFIEIRAIKTPIVQQGFFKSPEDAITYADSRAKDGFNIYIGVNPRYTDEALPEYDKNGNPVIDKKTGEIKTIRGGKSSVNTYTALYADCDIVKDGLDFDKAIAAFKALDLPPNYIVHSGRGLHVYWLIEPTTDGNKWELAAQQLKNYLEKHEYLKIDKQVTVDSARILRLVPYPNLKDGGRIPTKVIHQDTGRYTIDTVINAFPRLPEKPKSTQGVRAELPASEKLRQIKEYLSKLAPWRADDYNAWLNVLIVLKNELGDEGLEVAKEWSSQSDKYDEGESECKWYSIGERPEGERLTLGSLITWVREDNPQKRLTIRDITRAIAPESTADLTAYAPTDAGNAERLEALYGANIRYNHTTDKWVLWNGTRWQVDNIGQIDLLAIDVARATQQAVLDTITDAEKRAAAMKWALSLENIKHRKSMIQSAQSLPGIATTIDQYDSNTMLLGVQNGVIDLTDCTFRAAQQNDYITKLAGVAYDPSATCPRWEQFVNEVFSGDLEMVRYIQRAIGYTLTGDTREQVMFLAYGTGSNGKSTLFGIIQKMLGDYADTTGFSTFDADSRNEQTNDLAKLKGARFVSIAESDEDKRLNEAKVKSVTGQDLISCRFLHQEFFSYYPQFKIWLMVNHKPTIRGTDNGIWRRLQTVPFEQSFIGRADVTLKEKLEQELPGILNWALQGLQEWNKQGLNAPEKIRAAAAQYRTENDTVAQWLDECCQVQPDAYVTTDTAYTNYLNWSKTNGFNFPLTKVKLTQRLIDKGYTVQQKRVGFGSNSKNHRVYIGFSVSV